MQTGLREVINETRRAGSIISRLRSFVRKQKPVTCAVDINALVEDSLKLLDFELRHQGIRPQVELAENLPPVMVDAVQIEQVLVNLIYNALEAMEEQKAGRKLLLIKTGKLKDGGFVEIRISDNGPGMSEDNLKRLFEPFFTTKAKGLGMGLNISRSIIESHGGRMIPISDPGRGMEFCLTLPVAEQ
jgi:C4-dicarboxylate-specific signal transduction histidine kinase